MSNVYVTAGQLVARKYGLWLPTASNPEQGFDPNMLVGSTLNEKFTEIMTNWLYESTQDTQLEMDMCVGEGDGYYTSINNWPSDCRDRVLFGLSKHMFHPMGLQDITFADMGCLIMQYYDKLVYGPLFGMKPLERMNSRAWLEILDWSGLSDTIQHGGFKAWMMDRGHYPMESVNWERWHTFYDSVSQNTLRNVVLILKHGRIPLNSQLQYTEQRTYESLYNPDQAFWKTFSGREFEFQLVDYYNNVLIARAEGKRGLGFNDNTKGVYDGSAK